jgi:hypothetical protein
VKHAGIALLVLVAACSSHSQIQYGAGPSVNTPSAGLNVQASSSHFAVLLGLGIAAGVLSQVDEPVRSRAPELDPARTVNEQDCTRPIEDGSANLRCR